jgi:hypothetical protein
MTIVRVDLRAEAVSEAARLTAARRMLAAGDTQTVNRLEGDATWIATRRHTKLRRGLGRRTLLVWRATIEDASGRPVASRLVPVLIGATPSGNRRTHTWIATLLAASESLVRAHVDAACATWRADAIRTTNVFMAARLARENTIRGATLRPGGDAQPGLFDRRAARSREAHAAAVAASERAGAVRMRAIDAAAHIVAQPPRLLLVLLS